MILLMSKNIYAPSAVFHLMVLLLTKGGVLEYLIVSFKNLYRVIKAMISAKEMPVLTVIYST